MDLSEKSKKARIGDFYQLQNGLAYQFEAVKDIQEQLIALYGVQLNLYTPDQSNYFIKCKNFISKYECRFNLHFQQEINFYQGNRQRYLRLKAFMLQHKQICCQNKEQAAFLRNRRKLANLSDTLARLIRIRFQLKEPILNAIDAISELAKQENLVPKFYLDGIKSKKYQKMLNQQLDNIFTQALKRYQQYVSIKQKSNQQSQNVKDNKDQYEQMQGSVNYKRKVRKLEP